MSEKLYTRMRETKLRAAPHPDADVVANVPKGTEVEVFEERDNYYGLRAYSVEHGQVSGYVFKSLIGPPETDAGTTIEDKAALLPPCRECGAHNWRFVQLRTSGSASYPYIPAGFLNPVEVRARVCLTCGVVIPCVDSEGIEALKGLK